MNKDEVEKRENKEKNCYRERRKNNDGKIEEGNKVEGKGMKAL